MSGSTGRGSEIDDIRRRYDAGEFDSIRLDLERFISAHKTDIARYREEQERKGLKLTDEATVKFFIMQHRSINPRREIQEQLEEIRRETWIRGINSGRRPDEQEVAQDWARQHSAKWRAHRVTAIVYVFEREKERFCKLLC